ncbi:MAG: Na(+)-translocating NADH-quinone reductase subunit A [Succinivibrionaceae bacterium]|nr:Na(+)-translocating NADH-quinone reductase subunit A [Succinivibrionaceae bacterium]
MKTIRKGLDLPIDGKPEQKITDEIKTTEVALVASDYPGMRPTMLVEVGDTVKKGQPLFEIKNNPGVKFTAPRAGTVTAVNRGDRRAFQSLVIKVDDKAGKVSFKKHAAAALESITREEAQDELMESGLWTAFRTRPFGHVPQAKSVPHSIFVTAIDTNPLSVEPSIVIEERENDFLAGLAVLSSLTDGKVFVCKGEGSLPKSKLPRVQEEVFVGKHPAGLPGTHIHFLDPVSLTKTVWHIGYQDVLEIGALFTTGELASKRVISIAGPSVNSPKIVRTSVGAKVSELVKGLVTDGDVRVISGSVLYGTKAEGPFDFLGRFTNQVSALPEGNQDAFLGWIMPGTREHSVTRTTVGGFLQGITCKFTTKLYGGKRPILPIESFDKVMPLDIYPVLLLRSLAVTDTDEAQKLGCLELDEEDMQLLTYVDPGKNDWGPILRRNLDKIEKEG